MQQEFVFATVHDAIVDPRLLFMTDEAWFHVSRHVSAQNVRIWSDENPHATQKVPLHSEKVGVWRGVLCCNSTADHWPIIFPRNREL
jgi:hypothetical protein